MGVWFVDAEEDEEEGAVWLCADEEIVAVVVGAGEFGAEAGGAGAHAYEAGPGCHHSCKIYVSILNLDIVGIGCWRTFSLFDGD